MSVVDRVVPVVLFVYKRAECLARTLACLKENGVPRLVVFSDAPKGEDDRAGVAAVRGMLDGIGWCEVERHDREVNVGLGRNVVAGVTEALGRYERVLVWEDDLICVPGTYGYLCAALEAYKDDARVMSVTGWTNRHITPGGVGEMPYFDGRAECWVWGTWRRAWGGMEGESALEKAAAVRRRGGDPARYGGDLPFMAKRERASNIWAVRFLYHHMVRGGLCMRPPWSMVEHIGVGAEATNATGNGWLENGELRPCPPVPAVWPEPVENAGCAALHRRMCPRPWSDRFPRLVAGVRWVQRRWRERMRQG